MGDRVGCGYHGYDPNGEPTHDHTCDDCMLPEPHLDPPELNDIDVQTACDKIGSGQAVSAHPLPSRPF